METKDTPASPSVSKYSWAFAKNSDGKFAVFFANHQKDKDLFDDQATPWLDSMEQIFAWKHLFLFSPKGTTDEDFAEYHKGDVFRKLSSEEILRLSILGKRVAYNYITFDGSEPKELSVGCLSEIEVLDYGLFPRPFKEVDNSQKERTVD